MFGRTYYDRNTFFVGDFCNGLKVRDVITGVSNGLNVNGLGAVVNGSSDVFCLITLNKFGCNSQSRKENFELVIGTTVQVTRGYDIISCMS